MAKRKTDNDSVTQYALDVVEGRIVTGRLVRLACERHLRDLQSGAMRGLRWNLDVARHALDFFGYLRHSKGEWAGAVVHLAPWQQFRIGSVFGWQVRNPETGVWVRRFRTAYNEVARKNGKALALDTPIPSPSGWTTMGDLAAGDRVFDELGCVCTVLSTSQIMIGRTCYKVSFSDGSSIVADAEHLWWTESKQTGRPHGKRWRPKDFIRTTEQIRDTLAVNNPYNVKFGRVEHNHRVPTAGAIDLPERQLPLHPYVLGCWLGDGHSGEARITCGYGDRQLIEEIVACGVPAREVASSNANSGVYSLCTGERSKEAYAGSVRGVLRRLGLLNNKHIPSQYLRASAGQRMALLQGLMDTDGYVSKAGQCEFTTVNPRIRDGAWELLCTLGYKPTLKTDRARLNGKDCGEKYRIQFWAYSHQPVFRLFRKAARLKSPPTRPTRASNRQIVAVEPVPSVPVKCIRVSAPSSLYLAGRSFIPTHNSTEAAGVGLYMLDADDEPGAEVYSAATHREQAKQTWGEAARMVAKSPALNRRIEVLGGGPKAVRCNINVRETESKFEPLGADADSMDGLNVHCAIVDELHAHRNRSAWDVLETATGSRRQPLIWAITTAGTDQHGICYELRSYAVQVLEGLVQDDTFFAYIATLDEGDDPFDEAVWIKANPNLGISVKLDDLRRLAQKAAAMPTALNNFLCKRLSVWTQQSVRWLPLDLWDQNAGMAIKEADLAGRTCYGGLDLASVSDLVAWALMFPRDDDPEHVDLLVRFWCPEARLKDPENRYRDQYQAWERQGFLQVTPGNATDYGFVKAQILKDAAIFGLVDLNVDRLFQAHQLAMELADELGPKPDGEPRVLGMGQGFYAMAAPCAEFERRLLINKIHHGGNPVLRFCASNVATEENAAGSKKPDKANSQGKIDGIVAALMALDRAMRHGPPQTSVYETRGVITG